MTNHLARSSQDPSGRRLRRLSFRPIPETTIEKTEENAQITVKVPSSTLHYVARRRQFLLGSNRLEWQREPQGGPQKLLPSSQVRQEQHNITLPPEMIETGEVAKVEKLPTVKVPASKLDSRGRNSKVLVAKLEQGQKARQDDVSLLDTVTLFLPDTTQKLGIDDSQFDKLSTIPMMVLTGIAAQQGTSKPEMRSEVSGVASAASLLGFGSIIGSLLKYVSAFLIQYGFGPGGYGLYTLSLSLVSLIAATFNLGLDDAMVRYVAIYRGKQQPKSLQGLLIFCTALAGIAGIIGALLLLFLAPILVTYWITFKQHHLANKETLNHAVALLQILAPIIPLTTMQVLWFAGLRGFKAFKWRVLSSNILQPILLILLIGLVLLLFRSSDGIIGVAVALFISTLFNAVLNLYFLFREVSRVATARQEHYEVREWLTFASLNFLTTIVDTVLDSIDTILLATFGIGDVAIGQYGASIRLGSFIALPLGAINNVFAPTIAELHSKGEIQKLESMFKLITKWTITFSLPIFLITVLFSPYIMVLPGPGFASAWPLLIAFSMGQLINAATGAVGYMLLMTGYQRLSFLNSLVAVIVNIALGILLTPHYGAMGTAISTGVAICVLNLMRLLQVRVLLKMHPYRLDVLKPVAAGVISAVLVGGLLYLLTVSHVRTATRVGHAILSIQLLLIPVFLTVYIALIKQFKGSSEDEYVLKALSKKFLGGNQKNKKKVKEI